MIFADLISTTILEYRRNKLERPLDVETVKTFTRAEVRMLDTNV